ncbi:MAG TPA: DUF1565 domain-containing protein, partial [Phycisphaerae bacterium]|nr:DUF1565 domain-containing protein [Phycisphaerae bacterium]
MGKKPMTCIGKLLSAEFWTRRHISVLVLWLSCAIVLAAAPAARATTYYVATTGNDANPGTLAQPFRTIGHAVAVSVHGDSIQAAAGTYSESFTIPGTNLNLIGAGAATTILNGSINTSSG